MNFSKSVDTASENFKNSKFSVDEFKQILDHVENADFVDHSFIMDCVPSLTKEQVQLLDENQLSIQMDFMPSSSLLHKVLGGKKGTGIDESTFVVGVWGSNLF